MNFLIYFNSTAAPYPLGPKEYVNTLQLHIFQFGAEQMDQSYPPKW